jgi:hypothetical protein
MELATNLALADPSPKIQAEVIQYLQFRRADRHVARLLKGALDETWALVAKRGYSEEIHNPEVATRLQAERDKLVRESTDPLQKIGMLVEQAPTYAGRDSAIADAIADPAFPAKDQRGGSSLYLAYQRAPAAVLQGLKKRLEQGLDLPFSADDLLGQLPVIDEGPIAALALDVTEDKHDAGAAAILAGPRTVGALLDKYLGCVIALKTARNDRALSE